jgi:pimeloyl-ACP methyl ester carboxylesterase
METALLQQLLNIAQRKRIAKIPPDCTEYEAGFGLPPFEDRRSGSHFAILSRHQTATLIVATHPTEDLKKITIPVLVMHSEDDQIVPYVAAGPKSAKLLKNGTLITYKDFPHGMPTTHAEKINADLLAFLKS